MHHSLTNRFRGALLGTALGEALGAQCWVRSQTQSPRSCLNIEQWGWNELTNPLPFEMGKVVMEQASLLLNGTRSPQTASTNHLFKARGGDWPAMPAGGHATSAKTAIAALPIALAFHDDVAHLQQALDEAMADWQAPPESKMGAIVISHLVSLILCEQLIPTQLDVIVEKDFALDVPDPVREQMKQTVMLVNSQVDLVTAVAKIAPHPRTSISDYNTALDMAPIWLALYSFLSTPDDFRLTLLRAAQTQYQPQLTCAIAGLLGGTYSGMTGIPIRWRQRLSYNSTASLLFRMWGVATEASILKRADELWAVWAGAYPQTQPTDVLRYSAAIAAPNIIRPR